MPIIEQWTHCDVRDEHGKRVCVSAFRGTATYFKSGNKGMDEKAEKAARHTAAEQAKLALDAHLTTYHGI